MKTPSQKSPSASAGMTLLEVMVSVAIMTIVVGALSTLSITIGDVSAAEMSRNTAMDETRRGIEYLTAILRNASKATLPPMPAGSITFRTAEDLDGNGSAVNVSGNLELGTVVTVGRDTADANNDGVTTSQLIFTQGSGTSMRTVVLANELLPDEDIDGSGGLSIGEDTNNNGQLDRGIWFERVGNTVRVTLQAKAETRRGNVIAYTLTEMVLPRN